MFVQNAPDPSRLGYSERSRFWIPIVVPGMAVAIVVLIFLGAWFVLYRP